MKICQRQGWWFAKKIVYLHRKKVQRYRAGLWLIARFWMQSVEA